MVLNMYVVNTDLLADGPEELWRDERYLRVELDGSGEGRRAAQQDQPLGLPRDLLGALVPRRLVVLDEVRLVQDHHLELSMSLCLFSKIFDWVFGSLPSCVMSVSTLEAVLY